MKTPVLIVLSLALFAYSAGVPHESAHFAEVSLSDDRSFLLNYFQETSESLQSSIAGLSKTQMHYKPEAGQWSVSQCIEHIILTEKMLFDMAKEQMEKPANPERKKEITITSEQLIAGMTDRSHKVKTSEALEGNGRYDTPESAMRDFNDQRNLILAYMENTPVDSMRSHIGDSPFGPVDAYQSFLFIAGHVARHTLQIQEIKATAGFPTE